MSSPMKIVSSAKNEILIEKSATQVNDRKKIGEFFWFFWNVQSEFFY